MMLTVKKILVWSAQRRPELDFTDVDIPVTNLAPPMKAIEAKEPEKAPEKAAEKPADPPAAQPPAAAVATDPATVPAAAPAAATQAPITTVDAFMVPEARAGSAAAGRKRKTGADAAQEPSAKTVKVSA